MRARFVNGLINLIHVATFGRDDGVGTGRRDRRMRAHAMR